MRESSSDSNRSISRRPRSRRAKPTRSNISASRRTLGNRITIRCVSASPSRRSSRFKTVIGSSRPSRWTSSPTYWAARRSRRSFSSDERRPTDSTFRAEDTVIPTVNSPISSSVRTSRSRSSKAPTADTFSPFPTTGKKPPPISRSKPIPTTTKAGIPFRNGQKSFGTPKNPPTKLPRPRNPSPSSLLKTPSISEFWP